MRDLINIVESKKNIEIEEGVLDFIKKIAPVIDPIARARKHGQKEVTDLTKAAMSKFAQYIGRMKKDFGDVTWNTLNKYLTMQDQFGLDPAEVKKIIVDSGTKTNISRILSASHLPMPAANTWGKPAAAISGDPNNPQSNNIGLAIVTYIMELAAIKNLEKSAAGADMARPQPRTRQQTQQPQQQTQQQTQQPQQQTQPSQTTTTSSASSLQAALQAAIDALNGGTP